MTIRWMAALMGAMLSPAAMATVTVTFEGFYTLQSQSIDCAPMDLACAGRTTSLADPIAFSQTYSFEYGVSAGRLPFSSGASSYNYGGRTVDTLSASQRFANFKSSNPADAQIPAIPANVFDPVDRTHAQLDVYTLAVRQRFVDVWSDTGEIRRGGENFALTSAAIWSNADGSFSQDQLSIGLPTIPSFASTVANYDDLTTNAYFLDLIQRLGGCNDCLRVSLFNQYARADGVRGSTSFTGFGRIVSITETAAAVPEPSTYALMLAGVAAIGFAARRRKAA